MDALVLARNLGVGGLLAVAAVHANWARGSSWPLPDRDQLARTVVGSEEMPPATACLAVTALLTVAAGLVAGAPRGAPRLGRLGTAGAVAVLAARGLVGATGIMPPAARFSSLRLLGPPPVLALVPRARRPLRRRARPPLRRTSAWA